jgi:hypothetical protein
VNPPHYVLLIMKSQIIVLLANKISYQNYRPTTGGEESVPTACDMATSLFSLIRYKELSAVVVEVLVRTGVVEHAMQAGR